MKGKLFILHVFLLLSLTCSASDKNTSYVNNAYEVLILLEQKLKTFDYQTDQKFLGEIIDWAELICSKTIQDTVDYDFDDLIGRIEGTNEIDKILQSLINKTDAPLLEIVVNEVRFRTLVAIQHNLALIFSRMPGNQKFSSSIIFATTNREISQTKTGLINSQIKIISSSQKDDLKIRCWLALRRMLNEIDIALSETGDQIVQRSPYGIMIKKGELFSKLESLANSERDEEVKEFAVMTVELIKSSGSKYHDFNSKIIVSDFSDLSAIKNINKKALAFFNQALSSPENNQKIDLYSKAIESNPRFTAAFNNRGISYFEKKEYDSAIADFNNVLKLDPHKVITHYYLGNCYLEIRNYELAQNNYSIAIQNGFSDTSVYINRGLCRYKMGNYNSALEDLTIVIKMDSTSVKAFTYRAQCYFAINDYDHAIADYKTLIMLDPQNSTNYYNLGCIYWNMEDWHKVNEVWKKGLSVNPNDEYILNNLPNVPVEEETPDK